MSTLDEFTRSMRDLYQRLTVSGRRAAAVTRLRMELAGLDRQRRERFGNLGERVDELRRAGAINDAGLIGLLEEDFENIDRLRKRIQETMDSIQELNLDESYVEEVSEPATEETTREKPENLLDSFGVL